jgi:hypothetical protein
MIKSEIDATVAAIRALRKAGGKDAQFSVSERERAAMTHKMSKARDIENMKDDPVWFKQHREDTKYLQWSDGMYVMLDDLADPIDLQGYVLAVVENSLRDSVYFNQKVHFYNGGGVDCIGVDIEFAGRWWCEDLKTKITRAQALYIATGDVNI